MNGKEIFKKTAFEKIRRELSCLKVDALLVTGRSDIEYLIGFYFSGMVLMVSGKGGDICFIDTMNRAIVEDLLKKSGSCISTCSGRILDKIVSSVKERSIKSLYVDEENMSAGFYNRLMLSKAGCKILTNIKGKQGFSVVSRIRKIKLREEIRILRQAAKETLAIWDIVKKDIKVGMREKEIAAMIDMCVLTRGYSNSFPTIAAVGENTAYPHAMPGARRLKEDEHVLIDFGIRLRGYCSDLTRIWHTGRINLQIRNFYKIVKKAQEMAIKSIKPGMPIGAFVEKINGFFRDNKVEQYMLHGLGHGVGVDIHESPFLNEKAVCDFEEGMVLTIEPGLYSPGCGGVREEDMILVVSKGCEVLTI